MCHYIYQRVKALYWPYDTATQYITACILPGTNRNQSLFTQKERNKLGISWQILDLHCNLHNTNTLINYISNHFKHFFNHACYQNTLDFNNTYFNVFRVSLHFSNSRKMRVTTDNVCLNIFDILGNGSD